MLSSRAAAERLGLSIRRVQALIRAGLLKASNLNPSGMRPRWMIEEAELGRFASLKRPPHRPRRADDE